MKHEWIDYYVYLEKAFKINKFSACEILSNWMKFYKDIEKYLEEKKVT